MTTRTTGLVWLRRDLRIADNPALHAAVTECDAVIVLYIDSERDYWPDGGASRWWLHHSLTALDATLTKLGTSLTIQCGDPGVVINAYVETYGVSCVYWNHVYEPRQLSADDRLARALRDNEIRVVRSNGALLNEPDEIKTKTDTIYRVFTPYWRRAIDNIGNAAPLPAPSSIAGLADAPESLTIDALALLPTIDWDSGLAQTWTPGERGAQDRLDTFLRAAVFEYDSGRDLPGTEGVSRLSPHLHFGEISARSVWHQVQALQDDSDGTRIYLTELGWREFSHYILCHFPDTADAPMYPKYANFPWREDADALIKAWQQGRTGVPIVDAGMRQLWHTGWMHNRVRMIAASFLVKNIRAHWLHGARWFWDTLVDADLPANSMGWQWSAGSGADAAPYFRVFNPVRQGERFDKAGDYVRQWVPEVRDVPDKYLHAPWTLPEKFHDVTGFVPGKSYPLPIVDLATSRNEALAAFKTLKASES
ncbi:MAG: deoxyribodipyrimidine photo-lyase [Pseudomonadota bacterium]